MTDNPKSSAHQKCLRTAAKSSGQGAMMDVDCCSIRLSYFHLSGRADLNRQPTVPITHNLRPAEFTTDKRRTGNTCSTTELPRHLEPEAGLEPATTRLGGDNPILRPVETERQSGKRLRRTQESNLQLRLNGPEL